MDGANLFNLPKDNQKIIKGILTIIIVICGISLLVSSLSSVLYDIVIIIHQQWFIRTSNTVTGEGCCGFDKQKVEMKS